MLPQVPVSALSRHIKHCKGQTEGERERGRERCKSVYSDAHLPSFIFKNAFCKRLVFRILPGTLELFDVEADRWDNLLRRCLRTNTHIRKDTHKQNRQVMANVCQRGLSMKKSPTHTLPESHVSTLVTVGLKDWSAVNKQRYLNTNGIKMYSHQRTIHTTASIHAGVFFSLFNDNNIKTKNSRITLLSPCVLYSHAEASAGWWWWFSHCCPDPNTARWPLSSSGRANATVYPAAPSDSQGIPTIQKTVTFTEPSLVIQQNTEQKNENIMVDMLIVVNPCSRAELTLERPSL